MLPKFIQESSKDAVRDIAETDANVWRQFQDWYGSFLGQQLYQAEKRILERYLPDLFGYYLLQSGCPEIKAAKGLGKWLNSSRISCKMCFDPLIFDTPKFDTPNHDVPTQEQNKNNVIACVANASQLPVKADSLDIVVLPHVLEFSTTPHQVLREVERVLIAEGHVVILGFNPFSLWNIFRLVLFWKKQAPWTAHFLSSSRVIDWLALLGFDVVYRQGYFYKPPLQSAKFMNKMGFLEKIGQRFWSRLGAGYVLVARKRVETLTPIRTRWRSKRQVIKTGLETINRNKL